MPDFHLNHQSYERLLSLVRSGKYVDKPWSFSADDSNKLLGDDNWVEYEKWFLGVDNTADKKTKAAYGYPFGKGDDVYL